MERSYSNSKDELLIITMEECGELTQAASKVIRTNYDKRFLEELEKEAGDVLCMLQLLQERNLINWDNVEGHATGKRDKLKLWSHLFDFC